MERICAGSHCGRVFTLNPRVKDQRYCSRAECQKERRSLWHKRKIMTDRDYKRNQDAAQQLWRKTRPDYWRNYRKLHPAYTERNRVLQRERNRKARGEKSGAAPPVGVIAKEDLVIAKMDSLTNVRSGTYRLVPVVSGVIAKMDSLTNVRSGTYRLVPVVSGVIAKMDSLIVQLSIIPAGYGNAGDCKDRTR